MTEFVNNQSHLILNVFLPGLQKAYDNDLDKAFEYVNNEMANYEQYSKDDLSVIVSCCTRAYRDTTSFDMVTSKYITYLNSIEDISEFKSKSAELIIDLNNAGNALKSNKKDNYMKAFIEYLHGEDDPIRVSARLPFYDTDDELIIGPDRGMSR